MTKKTGVYGITLAGLYINGKSELAAYDSDGKVSRCWFAFRLNTPSDPCIQFGISNNAENTYWGALMGDGSTISLANPVLISVIRGGDGIASGAIVQFDMKGSFPSNSPCTLVKLDEENATWGSQGAEEPQEGIVANGVIPAWGYVVYNIRENNGGKSNLCNFVIPIATAASEYNFDISGGYEDWSALMPNGTTIRLNNPRKIGINTMNVVVEFSMEYEYSFDAPCVLIRTSSNGSFSVDEYPAEGTTPDFAGPSTEVPFVPVTDVVGFPDQVTAGYRYDLWANTHAYPENATNKDITWNIENSDPGCVVLNGTNLDIIGSGSFTLRARVENGSSPSTDFAITKNYTVQIAPVEGYIEPVDSMEFIKNNISGELYCEMKTAVGDNYISYQWYKCNDKSGNGGTPISGAVSKSFVIPTTLEGGTYYYYCVGSTFNGAASYRSNVTTISVLIVPASINISLVDKEGIEFADNGNMIASQNLRITVKGTISPEECCERFKDISYESSDPEIASVNQNGNVIFLQGDVTASKSVTITARSLYNTGLSASLSFKIRDFIPVESIVILEDGAEPDSDEDGGSTGEEKDEDTSDGATESGDVDPDFDESSIVLVDRYSICAGVKRKLEFEIYPNNATLKNDIVFSIYDDFDSGAVIEKLDEDHAPNGAGWYLSVNDAGMFGVVIVQAKIPRAIDGVNAYTTYVGFIINSEFKPSFFFDFTKKKVRPGKTLTLDPTVYFQRIVHPAVGNPEDMEYEPADVEYVKSTNSMITGIKKINISKAKVPGATNWKSGSKIIAEVITDEDGNEIQTGRFAIKVHNNETEGLKFFAIKIAKGLQDKNRINPLSINYPNETNPINPVKFKSNKNITIYGASADNNQDGKNEKYYRYAFQSGKGNARRIVDYYLRQLMISANENGERKSFIFPNGNLPMGLKETGFEFGCIYVEKSYVAVGSVTISGFDDNVIYVPYDRNITFSVVVKSDDGNTPSNDKIDIWYACELKDGKLPLTIDNSEEIGEIEADQEIDDETGDKIEGSNSNTTGANYVVEENGALKYSGDGNSITIQQGTTPSTVESPHYLTCLILNGKKDGDLDAVIDIAKTDNDYLKQFSIVVGYIKTETADLTMNSTTFSALTSLPFATDGSTRHYLNIGEVGPFNASYYKSESGATNISNSNSRLDIDSSGDTTIRTGYDADNGFYIEIPKSTAEQTDEEYKAAVNGKKVKLSFRIGGVKAEETEYFSVSTQEITISIP